jgi:hypothetical protein
MKCKNLKNSTFGLQSRGYRHQSTGRTGCLQVLLLINTLPNTFREPERAHKRQASTLLSRQLSSQRMANAVLIIHMKYEHGGNIGGLLNNINNNNNNTHQAQEAKRTLLEHAFQATNEWQCRHRAAPLRRSHLPVQRTLGQVNGSS